MVEHRATELDHVFHALADPTRRDMLRRLASGERTISELATPFAMSLAGASKHVRVLERAGLVRRRVAGRIHHCRLEAARLKQARDWISFYERFWSERLETLDDLLTEEVTAGSGGRKENNDE